MKAIMLAGVAAVTLGIGVASAQGLPASTFPQTYGSVLPRDYSATQSLNASNPNSGQGETSQTPAPRGAEDSVSGPAPGADGR
jgi:hypothetical protein